MTSTADGQFRIYLLRHAHAAWPAPGMRDYDRPLDAAGRQEAARLAGLMELNNYRPHRIICSPAARCAETLAILRERLAGGPDVAYEPELYSGSSDTYLDIIQAHAAHAPDALMIVGHNPMIDETAHRLLASGGANAPEALSGGFPTAGLLVAENISVQQPATRGHGRFIGLLSPIDA